MEYVALYHSFVSTLWNSKEDPLITSEAAAEELSWASLPVHVPCNESGSDLIGAAAERFQTSFQGFPMPMMVRVSPSSLRLNFESFPMRSLAVSPANSTCST